MLQLNLFLRQVMHLKMLQTHSCLTATLIQISALEQSKARCFVRRLCAVNSFVFTVVGHVLELIVFALFTVLFALTYVCIRLGDLRVIYFILQLNF